MDETHVTDCPEHGRATVLDRNKATICAWCGEPVLGDVLPEPTPQPRYAADPRRQGPVPNRKQEQQ